MARNPGDQRRYDERDLSRSRFIQRAQRCNFSLKEIGQLLKLRSAADASRPLVQRLTKRKLAEIGAQMADLDHLQRELELLLNLCRGSDDGCPIIESLDHPGAP